MYVAKADARALAAGDGGGRGRGEEPFHQLLRHPGAVVGDLDQHIPVLPEGPNADFPVAVGVGHAVVDGVFQDGLDDELEGVESLYTRLR